MCAIIRKFHGVLKLWLWGGYWHAKVALNLQGCQSGRRSMMAAAELRAAVCHTTLFIYYMFLWEVFILVLQYCFTTMHRYAFQWFVLFCLPKHICQSLDLILSGPDFCITLPVLWFRLGIAIPVSNCLLSMHSLIVAQVWRFLSCRVSLVWQTWEEATSPGRRVDFLSNSPKLKKHYPDIRYRICPYHDV